MSQFEQMNQFAGPLAGQTVIGAGALSPSVDIEIADAPAAVMPKNQIIRDAPRYCVTAGDLLTPTKKIQFQSFRGAQMGGMWFDTEEIPALWRTQGFILRGRITPLIKRPQRALSGEEIHVKRSGDQVEADGREVPGVFRPAYPYDSLVSLVAFAGRKGLVAVDALEGCEYGSGIIQEIQQFITPNMAAYTVGEKQLPFKLDEFEQYIESRKRATGESLIREVCDAFLRSAQVFRRYANEIIDFNRAGYDKGVNAAGFRQRITEVARFYAHQLGRRIDPQESQQIIVQNPGGPAAGSMSPEELELRRRELDLEERRLAIEEARLGIERPAADEKPAERAPEVEASSEAVSVEISEEAAEAVAEIAIETAEEVKTPKKSKK